MALKESVGAIVDEEETVKLICALHLIWAVVFKMLKNELIIVSLLTDLYCKPHKQLLD